VAWAGREEACFQLAAAAAALPRVKRCAVQETHNGKAAVCGCVSSGRQPHTLLAMMKAKGRFRPGDLSFLQVCIARAATLHPVPTPPTSPNTTLSPGVFSGQRACQHAQLGIPETGSRADSGTPPAASRPLHSLTLLQALAKALSGATGLEGSYRRAVAAELADEALQWIATRTVDVVTPSPSLIPTVNGNTVRSFSTHGQQSAAKGSSATVSRSDIRIIQHLDSSALGLVRRWLLIGAVSLSTYPPPPPRPQPQLHCL
jgi:hypothetical protein